MKRGDIHPCGHLELHLTLYLLSLDPEDPVSTEHTMSLGNGLKVKLTHMQPCALVHIFAHGLIT